MKLNYCPTCGAALQGRVLGDEGVVPYCETCSRPWFSFSFPCVICFVVDDGGNIALIKQSYVSEHFVCVAGHIKQGETAENTAAREVEEELGLQVLGVKYLSSYYFEKHDDLMLGFVCRVNRGSFNLSCEVEEARWFTAQEADRALRAGSVAHRLLDDYLASVRGETNT